MKSLKRALTGVLVAAGIAGGYLPVVLHPPTPPFPTSR